MYCNLKLQDIYRKCVSSEKVNIKYLVILYTFLDLFQTNITITIILSKSIIRDTKSCVIIFTRAWYDYFTLASILRFSSITTDSHQ